MPLLRRLKNIIPNLSDYTAIHYLINHESFDLAANEQETIENIEE